MDNKHFVKLALFLVICSFFFHGISEACAINNLATVSAEECPAERGKDWSYDSNLPNGPQHWGEKYPNCNGNSQSPVNIITRETESSGERQKLELNGYDEPIGNVSIRNTGSAIVITPQDGVERSVTLDGQKYPLQHFAFHWGNKTHKGSELVINNGRFTMETNLIHQNEGKFVAVAGFLEESHQLNAALYNILSVKESFQYEGQSFEGEIQLSSRDSHRQGKIYLDDLIDNNCPFYRYEGSLSFPPCVEGITWLVCRRQKAVYSYQLNQLFSLYSVKEGTPNAEKCHMLNIYRPVQLLNDRKVYKE